MLYQKPKTSLKHMAKRFFIGQTRSKDLGEKISEFLKT
jgi:hypothetical protein